MISINQLNRLVGTHLCTYEHLDFIYDLNPVRGENIVNLEKKALKNKQSHFLKGSLITCKLSSRIHL